MQPISDLVPNAAFASAEAAGAKSVKEMSPASAPGEEPVSSSGPQKPRTDEYTPGQEQAPSGRYWPRRDETGRQSVFYDALRPEKEERCTADTGRVDREIEQLKKQKQELERRIKSETDEGRLRQLEAQKTMIEQELLQKDNDTYRRVHAQYR